jgi:hypothetical protein
MVLYLRIGPTAGLFFGGKYRRTITDLNDEAGLYSDPKN